MYDTVEYLFIHFECCKKVLGQNSSISLNHVRTLVGKKGGNSESRKVRSPHKHFHVGDNLMALEKLEEFRVSETIIVAGNERRLMCTYINPNGDLEEGNLGTLGYILL